MRKKKIAAALVMMLSLIALSLFTPFVVNSVTAYVAQKIRGEHQKPQTESAMSEEVSEAYEEMVPIEAEETGQTKESEKTGGDTSAGKKAAPRIKTEEASADKLDYEEPFYETPEEEKAANQKAYQEMEGILLSREEAVSAYRSHFSPMYEELIPGMMNEFISGNEDLFYEEAANYCFGHYNTGLEIALIRFDAMLENTADRKTVILEFFSPQDLKDDSHVPDLALCTYNKKTTSFVFFTGGR